MARGGNVSQTPGATESCIETDILTWLAEQSYSTRGPSIPLVQKEQKILGRRESEKPKTLTTADD